MSPYIQPRWVHERQASGSIFLFGQSRYVTLAEAEFVGERVAIMTTEGLSESAAQEQAVQQLSRMRE